MLLLGSVLPMSTARTQRGLIIVPVWPDLQEMAKRVQVRTK